MHGVRVGSGWGALLAGFIVGGAGIGMINPPLASAAISVVGPARSGMASGINSTFRQVGIATGIAALGAIFQARVLSHVTAGLAGTAAAPEAHGIARAVASGGAGQAVAAAPPEARGMVGHVAQSAFVAGLNELFLVGAVVAFTGALLALALVRGRDFVTSRPVTTGT
jgi:hypothetical protein